MSRIAHRIQAGLVTLALGLGLHALTPPPARAATAVSDPRAVKVADGVVKALGGKQKWDALPGLRWTFGSSVHDTVKSSRRHAWDKMSGWHRVEGKNMAGDHFVIIHKVGTTEGRAWMNGQAIEGDSLQKLIARGERLWVNDTYWMLMPYKMRDPGVKLAWDSERKVNGRPCDVISMTFDHVGQTPGDHYWVYVDRGMHRVVRWDMVLEGDQPPPDTFTWDDWVEKGGLWFPTAHRQDSRNVFTRDVEAVAHFGPSEFTAP